ncbi:MAG: hypothetical protein LW809_06715 [Vampirovibrionales bacterium]|jgi:hypothetical protein|nr:hypothetical protein [Vampirovibrionales bacterium]
MASLPSSPSIIYPPSLPPYGGVATLAPVTTASKPAKKKSHKKEESSLNARIFEILNSIEKSNEESKDAPVPAYVKWGLPFLVASQVATLGLLAFNLKEMASLKASQRSLENTTKSIHKDLLSNNTLQDFLAVGQELISGATMSNPDLQPLSDALKTLNKTTKPKEWVNTATGVLGFFKTFNTLWQAPGKVGKGLVKVLTLGFVNL